MDKLCLGIWIFLALWFLFSIQYVYDYHRHQHEWHLVGTKSEKFPYDGNVTHATLYCPKCHKELEVVYEKWKIIEKEQEVRREYKKLER